MYKYRCFRNVLQKYLNKIANMFTVVNILIKKGHFKLFYTIIYNKEKFTTIYKMLFSLLLRQLR